MQNLSGAARFGFRSGYKSFSQTQNAALNNDSDSSSISVDSIKDPAKNIDQNSTGKAGMSEEVSPTKAGQSSEEAVIVPTSEGDDAAGTNPSDQEELSQKANSKPQDAMNSEESLLVAS